MGSGWSVVFHFQAEWSVVIYGLGTTVLEGWVIPDISTVASPTK